MVFTVGCDDKETTSQDSNSSDSITEVPIDKNSSADTETLIENKDGSDWGELTKNQKFHAISNEMYLIEKDKNIEFMNDEQFYIGALDEF